MSAGHLGPEVFHFYTGILPCICRSTQVKDFFSIGSHLNEILALPTESIPLGQAQMSQDAVSKFARKFI